MSEFEFPMNETLDIIKDIHEKEIINCNDNYNLVASFAQKLMGDEQATNEFIININKEFNRPSFSFLNYNIAEQIIDLITEIMPRQLSLVGEQVSLEQTCVFETLLLMAEKQRLAVQNKRLIRSGRVQCAENMFDEVYYSMEFENFYEKNLKTKKSQSLFENYCKCIPYKSVLREDKYVEDVSKVLVANPLGAIITARFLEKNVISMG